MKYLYDLIMGAKTPFVSGVFTSEHMDFFERNNIFYVRMGEICLINALQAKSILSHC